MNLKKAIHLQAVRVTAIAVLIVAVLFAYVGITVAWFRSNKDVNGNGMSVKCGDGLDMGDEITVRRYYTDEQYNDNSPIKTEYYKRDSDTQICYETDASFTEFFLDGNGNKIPFLVDTILPGERMEMSFTIKRAEGSQTLGNGYSIYFEDVTSDTFKVGSNYYSILGIYTVIGKIAGQDYSGQAKFLIDYEGALPENYELNNSAATDPDTGLTVDTSTATLPRVDLFSGKWGDVNELDITLLLHVDLSKYNSIQGTESNMLSEKALSIAALVVEPKEVP